MEKLLDQLEKACIKLKEYKTQDNMTEYKINCLLREIRSFIKWVTRW